MNLEKLNVQELSIEEQVNIEGGVWGILGGSLLGLLFYAAYNVGYDDARRNNN